MMDEARVSQAARRTASWVLIYDNAPHSVSSIRQALEATHRVSVHRTPATLAQRLEGIRRDGGQIAFVILDMHDEKIVDLRKLGRRSIGTLKGTAVGLAMTKNFIWDPQLGFGKIPVLIYSARTLPEESQRLIKQYQSEGQPIVTADKEEPVDDVLAKTSGFHVVDYAVDTELTADEIRDSLKSHADQAFKWDFSEEEVILLFGYNPDRNESVDDLIASIADNPSKDDESRIHLLIDIRLALNTLFGEDNLEAQISWLESREDKFGGRSAKSLLVGGTIEDLFLVAYYMRDRVG